ncbi:helix-turn-helix domain-containing protein [Flavobacterium sp.]|uniref:helix-turn-helix domain-containing protein n=1 Tax=Flavobacterium sp. TaxID=239 RepID=UPI0040333382
MQKELDDIKREVTQRIYKEFQSKFEGNNRKFAKAVGCDEKTIRLIFDHNQGMTLNLFFRIAAAIEVEPSVLLEGLNFKKEN